MSQRKTVCQECDLLDQYLVGRTCEMPCIICDRLWCEATLKRYERGETLALSGWGILNATPHEAAAPSVR